MGVNDGVIACVGKGMYKGSCEGRCDGIGVKGGVRG